MRSEIVVRFSVDNEEVPHGLRPDQHFAGILKDLRDREPETEFEVKAGVLDTLKDKQVQGPEARPEGGRGMTELRKRWCYRHGWVRPPLVHSERPRCGQVTVGRPSPEIEAAFKAQGR